jgi:hypothetical protein
VRIRAEGANVAVASTDPVIGSESALAAVADAKGWVAVDIQPFDFNVTLAVTASSTSDKTGEWMGALPVVPGAMRATLHGGRLLVTSPIPRRVGYLSLVTEGARIASARLEFRPGPRGRAVAFHELPQHVTVHKSLWAVVSAEPHLDAAATVGWPIMLPSRKGHTLQESYTVADRLLLDGRPLIRHLQQNQRRRAQWLAGLFCALAVLLVAVLTLSRARSAHHHLVRHLRAAGQSDADVVRVAGESRWLWVTALAIFLLALGYAIVALVAIARVG